MNGGRSNARVGGSADLPVEIYAQFRRPLLAFFNRRVRDTAEAEDLTQEVFVRLIRRKDDEGIENVKTYVFQIAANLLRDRARKNATHCQSDHFSFDADAAELAAAHEIGGDLVEDRGPERVLLGEESLTAVLCALSDLGERTRDVFILHRLEGMKHREIAQLYGISVSMVEKLVMQAASHLVRCFGKS